MVGQGLGPGQVVVDQGQESLTGHLNDGRWRTTAVDRSTAGRAELDGDVGRQAKFDGPAGLDGGQTLGLGPQAGDLDGVHSPRLPGPGVTLDSTVVGRTW